MDPDADPGSPVVTPVSSPLGTEKTGGDITTAVISPSEAMRHAALRALAETATKRGIPLRNRDGTMTPGSAKPEWSGRPKSTARHATSGYTPLLSAFDTSPLKPRAIAGSGGLTGTTDGNDKAVATIASSNPFQGAGGDGVVVPKSRKKTSEVIDQLEHELEKVQTSAKRERDALRSVAEKVKRNARDEIQDAQILFTARQRQLETEKDTLTQELERLTNAKTELEASADSVTQKCESLFEQERAQCIADVEQARLEAAEEMKRREEVWQREREQLKKGVSRAVTLTEKDREHERERADRQFQEWEHEREDLTFRLQKSKAARAEEARKIESANTFRNAVRQVVADKKMQRVKVECARLVSSADSAKIRVEEEAAIAMDTATKKFQRQKERLEADLRESTSLRETDRKSFEGELAKLEAKRSQQVAEFELRLAKEREAFEADRSAAEARRVQHLAEVEAHRAEDQETFEQRLSDAEKRRVDELAEAEARRATELHEAEERRTADRLVFEHNLQSAEKRRVDELADSEARRVRDREALEQRLLDAEERRVSELAEAETRRVDDLAAAAEKARTARDTMLAQWHNERREARAEVDAAAEVAAAMLESVKYDLEASRAAADILSLERDAARGAADESERVRAEATAFAESWRAEAEKSRSAADAARDDAERAILAGRAETAAELERLREAHEVRVADASAALEAERRVDAETTAHAVSAAEAGVSAALEEALSAVSDARQDARDAAAAFSVTLVFRAWWLHTKHKGSNAQNDAVQALLMPKRRATRRACLYAWFHLASHSKRLRGAEKSVVGKRNRAKRRQVLREWLQVSPRVTDVQRARGAWSRRVTRRGFVGWCHVVAETAFRATHAEALAQRQASKNLISRRYRSLSHTFDLWRAVSHAEKVTRVAFIRGADRASRRRLKGCLAEWHKIAASSVKFQRVTKEFIQRRRLGTLRTALRSWYATACAEAHEAHLVSVASERFWRSKAKRVLRGWYAITRGMFVERRVIGAYVQRRRRLTKLRFFKLWRDLSLAEVFEQNQEQKALRQCARRNRYVCLACVGAWRLYTSAMYNKRERVETCETLAVRLIVTRLRRIRVAVLRSWLVLTQVANVQRVAVIRHLARKCRSMLLNAMREWKVMFETEEAGVERLLEARLRRQDRRHRGVGFSRWVHATKATAEKMAIAKESHIKYVKRHFVLRPWRKVASAAVASDDAAQRKYESSVLEADRRFGLITNNALRIALNGFKSNAYKGRRATKASEYFQRRRDVQIRSRVWALWSVISRDAKIALERYAAMRKRNSQKACFTHWRRNAQRELLERALELRREVALKGFKKVGAWRLVERVMLNWCTLADDAARGRHNVALMRKVRLAERVIRKWSEEVENAKKFHAVFARVVSAGVTAQKARFFVAWRAGMRHDARDAARREAKATARGALAPMRHAVNVWREATRDARLEVVAVRRATRRAVATTWRKAALGFVAWRCFAGDTEFRHATSRGASQRAEAHTRRILSRRAVSALREWRRVACVDPRRVETCLGRGDVRRVAATFRAWRFDVALGPRERTENKAFERKFESLVASFAERNMKRVFEAWHGVIERRAAAAALATRREQRRLATAVRVWQLIASAVAEARDDASRRHRLASLRRASSARRVSVFDAWRDRARMSTSAKSKLDASKERVAETLARRVAVTFATRVLNEWADAARTIVVGRQAFLAVMRCIARAQICADAAWRLRLWHSVAREARLEAAQEQRRGDIASTLVARRARNMSRSVTRGWHTATRRACLVRQWMHTYKLKQNRRALHRTLDQWRRARVESSRKEVPVVRAWQKQIDRASAKRAAADSMRRRRDRSKLVHRRFYAWRRFANQEAGLARAEYAHARAADSMWSRRQSQSTRNVFDAWHVRVRALTAAEKLGAARGLVRATRRCARCFSAWATLSCSRPRWNLGNRVASRRLNALGACLQRASGRVVEMRFQQWARRAAICAARRAAETQVAATEASRLARVARDEREAKRTEVIAASALAVAESVSAREQMDRIVHVDVAALDAPRALPLGPVPCDETETETETDPVSGVSHRLAMDAADAAALRAAAVAARRAATEATNNELLAREALEAAREEIAHLRAAAGVGDTDVDPEMAAELPAPGVDVGVGKIPPFLLREASAQTAPSTPVADTGVGPSPPLSPKDTPPATPRSTSRSNSPAPDVASPLETLAAADLEFAFSSDNSPRSDSMPHLPSGAPWAGTTGELRDARGARALAERLEAALTATAAAESRARVAEAAAVAAEAAAFDAVETAVESASRHSTPSKRNVDSPMSTPRSSQRSPSWGPPPGSSTPRSKPRTSSFSSPTPAPRRPMSASSLRTRPTWGSSGSVKLDDGRETRESKLLRAELERKVTALEKALAKRDAALLSSRDEAATANEKLLDKTQRLALLEQESSRNETKMRRDSERLQVLELRARELETKASLAETKARDAETQVTAAEASGDAAVSELTRCRASRDEARSDANAARSEADTLRSRLEASESRCVDLAAQVNAWVERGFDVIRASSTNSGVVNLESPEHMGSLAGVASPGSQTLSNSKVSSPTVIGTPAWYATRFEKPSLGDRSGTDAAAWAANAAAETPPLQLLSDLKRAAREAIDEKDGWKKRAEVAETQADLLVTTGEDAIEKSTRDALAASQALEQAEQAIADADIRADAAERRASDASRAASARQKAARTETASLVAALSEAREQAARAAADAAETRAKAGARVATKLADAEKRAATAEATSVASLAATAAAELRARADVDAATQRLEARAADAEAKAHRASQDYDASKTREHELRSKLDTVRDDAAAAKTTTAEAELKINSLRNELDAKRSDFEQAHVQMRLMENQLDEQTKKVSVSNSKARDLQEELQSTMSRLERQSNTLHENEDALAKLKLEKSRLEHELIDARLESEKLAEKAKTADTLEAELKTAKALFAKKNSGHESGTQTRTRPCPPGSVGSFEEAVGDVSDAAAELADAKAALKETRAALREVLQRANRSSSPSTPLESADDHELDSEDELGVGKHVLGVLGSMAVDARASRQRHTHTHTELASVLRERDEMRSRLLHAAETEQLLRSANMDLKLRAMTDAVAGSKGGARGSGRNEQRIERNPRGGGLRSAEAALESALAELTGR